MVIPVPNAAPPDYRLAFQLAPVGLILSLQRRIMDCNERVCEMFGATPAELIGQSFRILYPSATAACSCTAVTASSTSTRSRASTPTTA